MDEQDKEALETLRGLTLQVMLLAAGVFGIVGGFIASSEKPFSGVVWLMSALISFAVSGLFGYLVHGVIIGLLNEQKRFSAKYHLIQTFTLIQIVLFFLASASFILFIFLNVTPAKAQGNLESTIEIAARDPYTKVVSEILDDWNGGVLRVKADEIRQSFEGALARRVESPVYTFEQAPEYTDLMIERFEALGAEIEPELPVSAGARLILLGSVLDRREHLSEILGDPNAFLDKFLMEIIITLGAGQQEAKESGVAEIDARSIIAAYDSFRSVIYPFCCWREYR